MYVLKHLFEHKNEKKENSFFIHLKISYKLFVCVFFIESFMSTYKKSKKTFLFSFHPFLYYFMKINVCIFMLICQMQFIQSKYFDIFYCTYQSSVEFKLLHEKLTNCKIALDCTTIFL